MPKLVRIKKLSLKVVFVYVAAVVLFACSDPLPRHWSFPTGLGIAAIGELLRVWAAGHLAKNERLTTTGPYAHVKNPLYIGTFLITCGLCILARGTDTGNVLIDRMNWFLLGLFVLIFLLYYVPYKRRREGNRLRELFGPAWQTYEANVPDYLPRLRPWRDPAAEDRSWSLRAFLNNSEHWTFLGVAALAVAMCFREDIMVFIARFL